MALFRRLFYRKPPDRLLEITERVYVFDCCFSTETLEAHKFKTYIDGIVLQLREYFPETPLMVFNFRHRKEKNNNSPSPISTLLSQHNITSKDYPHQFSNCPLLPLETISQFLSTTESWLDSPNQNILLMHCETGGWPILAFMLASLLLYRKQYTGEQRTLDMVYKQGPKELIELYSTLNPCNSHVRYLQYIGKLGEDQMTRNLFTLDCLILRVVPNFDGDGGCRPIVRVYGQDQYEKNSRVLFSTSKTKRYVKHYKADNAPVKMNVGCRVEGDVVLECINVDHNMEREELMFRVMFNTAFIQSHILMLSVDDVDLAWNSKDQFSKDFTAEVLFSEFHPESDASSESDTDMEMDFAEEFYEAEEMLLESPVDHESTTEQSNKNLVEFGTPRSEPGSYFPFSRSRSKRFTEDTSYDNPSSAFGTPREGSIFLREMKREAETVHDTLLDGKSHSIAIQKEECLNILPEATSTPPPPLTIQTETNDAMTEPAQEMATVASLTKYEANDVNHISAPPSMSVSSRPHPPPPPPLPSLLSSQSTPSQPSNLHVHVHVHTLLSSSIVETLQTTHSQSSPPLTPRSALRELYGRLAKSTTPPSLPSLPTDDLEVMQPMFAKEDPSSNLSTLSLPKQHPNPIQYLQTPSLTFPLDAIVSSPHSPPSSPPRTHDMSPILSSEPPPSHLPLYTIPPPPLPPSALQRPVDEIFNRPSSPLASELGPPPPSPPLAPSAALTIDTLWVDRSRSIAIQNGEALNNLQETSSTPHPQLTIQIETTCATSSSTESAQDMPIATFLTKYEANDVSHTSQHHALLDDISHSFEKKESVQKWSETSSTPSPSLIIQIEKTDETSLIKPAQEMVIAASSTNGEGNGVHRSSQHHDSLSDGISHSIAIQKKISLNSLSDTGTTPSPPLMIQTETTDSTTSSIEPAHEMAIVASLTKNEANDVNHTSQHQDPLLDDRSYSIAIQKEESLNNLPETSPTPSPPGNIQIEATYSTSSSTEAAQEMTIATSLIKDEANDLIHTSQHQDTQSHSIAIQKEESLNNLLETSLTPLIKTTNATSSSSEPSQEMAATSLPRYEANDVDHTSPPLPMVSLSSQPNRVPPSTPPRLMPHCHKLYSGTTTPRSQIPQLHSHGISDGPPLPSSCPNYELSCGSPRPPPLPPSNRGSSNVPLPPPLPPRVAQEMAIATSSTTCEANDVNHTPRPLSLLSLSLRSNRLPPQPPPLPSIPHSHEVCSRTITPLSQLTPPIHGLSNGPPPQPPAPNHGLSCGPPPPSLPPTNHGSSNVPLPPPPPPRVAPPSPPLPRGGIPSGGPPPPPLPGRSNGAPVPPAPLAPPGRSNGSPAPPAPPGRSNGSPASPAPPAPPGRSNGSPAPPAPPAPPGRSNGAPAPPAPPAPPGRSNGAPAPPAPPGRSNGAPAPPAPPAPPGRSNGAPAPPAPPAPPGRSNGAPAPPATPVPPGRSNGAPAPPAPPVPPGRSNGAPPAPPPPGGRPNGGPAPPPPPRGNGGAPPAPPIVGRPGAPPPPNAQAGKGSGRGLGIGRSNPKPKSPFKPYHWVKVTRAMQGSLWAELQNQAHAHSHSEFDVKELETLFSAVVPKPKDSNSEKKKSAGSKSDKIHLVDLRRANNTEIMLTKIKMPLSEMMSAALAMDESVLDADQVENLIKFCPTKEEMELLKNYTGDKENLGKCEQFFLELMKVPRVESKLRVFSFKIQFGSQIAEIKKNLQTVNAACDELRNSDKLKEIMKKILFLGNTLNQGTARGSAVGFRLDSLPKLTETRAINNKITLMHYLCRVIAEKTPKLLEFHEDLVSLEAASKVQLKVLMEEQQAVVKGLEKVELELKASEKDGPVSDVFRKTLKEFTSTAGSQVRALTDLYNSVGKNADGMTKYFGEEPAKCPFEQVTSTLLNFVRLFRKAHDENIKNAEQEKKKAQKEAELERSSTMEKKKAAKKEAELERSRSSKS